MPKSEASAGQKPAQAAPAAGLASSASHAVAGDQPMTRAEYAQRHLPRFATLPWSAEVFDNRQVTADPQLTCMSSHEGADVDGNRREASCTCLTEQGTYYEISQPECRRIARFGPVYNPYRVQQPGGGVGGEPPTVAGVVDAAPTRAVTFAVAVGVIALWHRGQDVAAVVLFLAGSLFVDYQWTGVALIVAGWAYFRTGTREAAAATLVALVGLAWPNGTFWALAALPVIAVVEITTPRVPRLRWAFYAYYPGHLLLLACLNMP